MPLSLLLTLGFTALVGCAAAVFLIRRRKRRSRITDEDIHRLIRGESSTLPGGDDPLDLEQIEREEEEFWEGESWDRADPL